MTNDVVFTEDCGCQTHRSGIRRCPLHSAAPALLEACKACVNAFRDHLQYDDEVGNLEQDTFKIVLAAIALAEPT